MSVMVEARDALLEESGRRGGRLAGVGSTYNGEEDGKMSAMFSAERRSWALENVLTDFARAGNRLRIPFASPRPTLSGSLRRDWVFSGVGIQLSRGGEGRRY